MKRSDIDDLRVIALAEAWQSQPSSGYGTAARTPGVVQALMDEGVPAKVARAKVEHLSERGLLDWGVSSNYAWPTAEGLALLRSARDAAIADWERSLLIGGT